MTKPTSVAIRETKERLCAALNESGLTYDIAEYVLRELLEVVHENAEASYRVELSAWQQEQLKEKEEADNGLREDCMGE